MQSSTDWQKLTLKSYIHCRDAQYWIFADIQYANILQFIWPIIDTDTDIYVYFFPTPNCRDHQVSSVVELTYSIIMHTLNMWAS